MDSHPLRAFVRQLLTHSSLTAEETSVLLSLPSRAERVRSHETVFRSEGLVQSTCVLERGLLARTSDTSEGARQIISFFVPGDIADLQTFVLPTKTFTLRAMGECEVQRIPHEALQAAFREYPGIAEALFRAVVLDANITAEWVVNVGRRPAKQRIAHIFCEMAIKNGAVQRDRTRFLFPVTQTILGDAAGISPVHVNRSIQSLRKEGLLFFEQGIVEIPDLEALQRLAGFDANYMGSTEPLRFSNELLPAPTTVGEPRAPTN